MVYPFEPARIDALFMPPVRGEATDRLRRRLVISHLHKLLFFSRNGMRLSIGDEFGNEYTKKDHSGIEGG